MLDFMKISTRIGKRGTTEIYPKFIIKKSSDLMIRGSDFYAVWVEERGLWSTDEQDAIDLIDAELDRYANENKAKYDDNIRVLHLWDSETGMIDRWHNYCKKQMRDSFNALDEKLIFSNAETNKKDYASKRLPYPLEAGDMPGYESLISTLYSEKERHKIEWAIGAIVSGDSKHIQKFLVLYGEGGTGKSTILNIIQQLFEGYYSVFDAKALGSNNASFALEAFKKNPLVAIQHDGDLSKIEDNTRLNSLVSHELMTVNEKFKSQYENRFKCFLFMGTNRPVKITDGKSGIIRRLIDVSPTGNKLGIRDYKRAVKQIDFELGAIASHCLKVYQDDPGAYDDYIPITMLGASNDFYNFIIESYHIFKKENGTTLKAAWAMYNTYCEEAKVPYPFSQRNFKEELKNYFWKYDERFVAEDGSRLSSYYSGFRTDKFEKPSETETKKKPEEDICEKHSTANSINFQTGSSIFDVACRDCKAQYAAESGTPMQKWEKVQTTLSDIDTSKLHYVKVPENHIVIDFDIKGPDGKKSLERNLEGASKWPATYAELSKSGAGIHLHYIYTGDPSKLSRIYDENIEIKVFTGNSSLRRKLTKRNDLPIATISSGLPLKGEKNLVNTEVVTTEKGLRTTIKRSLNKEIHGNTRCEIDWIFKILEDAYNNGTKYDVSDLKNAIFGFAANSTNQSDYCIKKVNEMHFKSEEPSEGIYSDDAPLVFYDIEVFPNLFLVNWKYRGKDKSVVRMINPKPADIEALMKFNLIGFNCRRYDNHILYARLLGYSNEQLYDLSQRIIAGSRNAFFSEAYNVSYTDVYDFSAKKQSLKKWEIELGIHHQELGLPWDQPVPEELWIKVAEYCDNDVIATEAVFEHLTGDFTARQILADLAGMSVNDTTNSLTGKIIFGNNRKPQSEFNHRDLSKPVYELDPDTKAFLVETFPEMMSQPHGKENSLLPYFEGYKYHAGKSTYKGVEVGEGGRVFAKPGIYGNVALLDIASMHPHSAMAEALFGPRFTRRFRDIVYGRVNIKHEDWEELNNILDGKLTPYVQKVIDGEMTSKDLANALKIAINSVYGLTAASFDNLFRDPRNIDNIVAKRGALFMVDLQEEVEARGYTVAHIKTDSIKIPDATPEIIQFVMDFGKRYGYTFEHEATYDRMCLVNDAVYIARYDNGEWTATGTQFAVPYVFKTLFSKELLTFEDMCETFAVSKGDLYLDLNEGLPDVSLEEKIRSVRDDIAAGKADKRTKKDLALCEEWSNVSDEDLDARIAEGHNLRFVGRVGRFCPIKPGYSGGILYRVNEGKNFAASGTKGYRWLESETVKVLEQDEAINDSFYKKLVDDAVASISEYGDFEWFVSDDPYISEKKIPELVYPPWNVSCGKKDCTGCPHLNVTQFDIDCKLGYDLGDVAFADEERNNFDARYGKALENANHDAFSVR